MFKEKVKGFIAGVVITAMVMFSMMALAEYDENIELNELLTPIYVSFNTVKHILIKDVEKTPPTDMQPFVYNGRTYVALRYVSEALGQNVNWDEKTGTVSIGGEEKGDVVKSYSNKLTDFDLLQKWDYFGDIWKVDGENGLASKYNYLVGVDNNFGLLPKITLPSYSNNYEIEVDALFQSGFEMYFAKQNQDDTNVRTFDCISFNGGRWDTDIDGWWPGSTLKINDKETDINPDKINISKSIGQFCNLKVKVKNNISEVYLNDTYINANKIKGSVPAVGFGFGHFKNLKVTIND